MAAATPAMSGSLLLLTVLFGWLGRWEALVLLAWLASGAAVCTPAGERLAVRAGCGFHRPSGAQAAALAPLWEAALRRTGTAAGDVDLYVQRSHQDNAYTAGGRSVAVTTGVLEGYLAHRLTEDQFVAVLVHELGHYATRATRFALLAVWLAMPWRVAARLVLASVRVLCGRQPRSLLVVVVCAGVGVAVVQAIVQRDWLVAVVVTGVAVLTVSCPLAAAAASRRAEFVADRFAADQGLAVPLAAALRALGGERSAAHGRLQRTLASHPAVDRRIDALLARQQ
jgi:STE24 endopeptidase